MKSVQSYFYDFQRFGLTPTKLVARLGGRAEKVPRVLTVTMPKSGTNLLQRILVLHVLLSRAWLPTLGRRNSDIWKDPKALLGSVGAGRIVSTHFDFDMNLARLIKDELQYKILLMIRDPRDAVISDMHYILSWPGHSQKTLFESMASDKERLMTLISGSDVVRPIREQILRFSGWADYAHLIRFEDAVGAGGGGSDDMQRMVVGGIFDYLGISLSDSELEFISANCRSAKTQTFRTGAIRNWERVFDADLSRAFKDQAGDLLVELGYEKSYDW